MEFVCLFLVAGLLFCRALSDERTGSAIALYAVNLRVVNYDSFVTTFFRLCGIEQLNGRRVTE
jgi:hypothetical protein